MRKVFFEELNWIPAHLPNYPGLFRPISVCCLWCFVYDVLRMSNPWFWNSVVEITCIRENRIEYFPRKAYIMRISSSWVEIWALMFCTVILFICVTYIEHRIDIEKSTSRWEMASLCPKWTWLWCNVV